MSSYVLPEKLLQSLQGIKGFDRNAFIKVHENDARVVSVRMNPFKPCTGFPVSRRVPWSSSGYYLPSRPAFILDPCLHAGAYYVQEASGMFLEQCLRQTMDLSGSLKILDLCAAPGGKSTLIQSLITKSSLLVSNEVIRARVNILAENLTKWGGDNTIITSNDPRDLGRLPDFFDALVVDAPCSGSGLFRRDPSAIKEWSATAVEMCGQRQQRILSDVLPALRENGILIYSTCSYSAEENEVICDWLCESAGLVSLKIDINPEWNIIETNSNKKNAFGYRFFPDKLEGEGFFIACFRKTGGGAGYTGNFQKSRLSQLSPSEYRIASAWLNDPARFHFYQSKEIFAFPKELQRELETISLNLYIKQAGLPIGKLVREELVPAHGLALSGRVSRNIPVVSLKKEQALQYLRKEEVTIELLRKGWALIQYEGLNLGWTKLLINRMNNYYPKEWRILKSGSN